MKKVVLFLVVGGLSISGDCFATDNNFDNGLNQNDRVAFREVKSDSVWSKVKGNTKKILGKKIFQVATIGTATVVGAAAGTAVTAYYCAPNFAEFVNSNAKVIATYTSNALRDVANYIDPAPAPSKIANYINPATVKIANYIDSAPSKIANYIGPAPTFTPSRWDEARHVVNGFMDALGRFADGAILFAFFKSLSYSLKLHRQGI